MGLVLPLLVALLLISSSLSNPISLDRAAPWPPEDIGILEQNAPKTTQLSVSDKLTCDNSGAERCLLFPIGCVPGENCTDRLEMRRVQSGSNQGDIIISLNLHVSRTAHMLVAVPMPDLSNPNSTFLIGCSIDEAIAVVAKPDVDGITEQLQLPWLRLVAVRATSDELECIVSASPGFVDLPEGDVAVFAGDLEPEEEIRQSSRISGSMEEREEEREGERSRERVQVESSIQKISPPLISHERTTQSLDHSESDEPILTSIEHQAEPILRLVEDQRLSTTELPKTTVAAISNKANKLRLKMLHSSENSSGERAHRHSSAEKTHSTHATAHHESTSTTTTTQKTTTTSTTEAPEVIEEEPEIEEPTETTETPSTQTTEQSTTGAVKEEEKSTTVLPSHNTTHHHGDSHEHHKEKTHHSHERATVDKEHHSVRMEPVTTTTSEKPNSFEDDKDLPEEDKELLRKLQAGHVKEERREGEEEEEETHAEGTEHHKHATVYELTREAAQDPIGRRPSEHSHSHSSSSHGHSHEHRAIDDEEEEHTTKKPVHSHKKEEEDEGRQRMGEKKHQRRSEETEEEEEEDDDDSSSSLSLIIPMIIILAPVLIF